MAAQRNAAMSRVFWIASIMFFLSGGTGLAYQVIWFKRFAHVWGSSSLAFASVGASFLFGLGLGAYLIGRLTDRLERPLRWYGIAEIAIGALALVIPFQIGWLIEASSTFYSQLPTNPVWRYMIQFAVTVLVVGPPTVLMGGTLPLLIRQLTAREGSLDQATGWLYAINTFGAALGCYFTGFYLLPKVGLYWTNIACASLNIAIGLVSVMVSAKPSMVALPRVAAVTKPQAAAKTRMAFSLIGLYVAVGLSGLGALVLEMTWSRQLALLLGGSTYAYTSTLFVVLLGIALGSLIFHLGLRRVASSPWLPFTVIGVLVISCLVGVLILPQLAVLMADYRNHRGTLMGNGLVCVMASMLLELVPAIAMGVLFPLFVHLTHESAAKVGRAVGDVYAWNTLGSIFGASLTAVLLFPLIGTQGAIALAAGAYLIALLLVLPIGTRLGWGLMGATTVVGGAALAGILWPQDPRYTNMGMYMYGNISDRIFDSQILYFAEGASSNVLVTAQGPAAVSLRVNGKVDASDGLDMQTQLGSAYLPRIFKPDAREVFIIGFGSGTTIGASTQFADTFVTCCEIEPAVYYASEYFGHVNHRPHELTREYLRAQKLKQLSPGQQLTAEDEAEIERQTRVRMIFGDGRSVLQGSDKKYDLIISEPSNPWLAGVSNLFTEEFFQAAKDHLNEGGVLAQWIQTYNFTWSDYLMIVRTMSTRFKHFGVILLAGGADTVLVASDQPLFPSPETLAALQEQVDASETISNDLRTQYGTTSLAMLLMRFYKADDELMAPELAAGSNQLVNNDLNLRLEFDTPIHLFQQLPAELSARTRIQELSDSSWLPRLGARLGVRADTPEFQVAMAEQSVTKRKDGKGMTLDVEQALSHLQKAIEIDPRYTPAYIATAKIHQQQKKPEAALALLEQLLKQKPDDVEALLAIAAMHQAAKKPDEAAPFWAKALEHDPKNASALLSLGLYQQSKGLHADAVQSLTRLVEVNPRQVEGIAALANEHMVLKNYDEAIKNFRAALQLRGVTPSAKGAGLTGGSPIVWANNLAWLLATSPEDQVRNGEEAVHWAKVACEATGYKPEFLDTLAAAHAEAGDFDEAVRRGQQFIDQSQHMPPELLQAAKQRLQMYQQRQPYRES